MNWTNLTNKISSATNKISTAVKGKRGSASGSSRSRTVSSSSVAGQEKKANSKAEARQITKHYNAYIEQVFDHGHVAGAVVAQVKQGFDYSALLQEMNGQHSRHKEVVVTLALVDAEGECVCVYVCVCACMCVCM
jgi:cell division septum initiation protein DivIVA